MIACRGVLPPVSDHPPSRNVQLYPHLLVLSALHRFSSCADQRHGYELYRRYLCLGRFRSIKRRFWINNNLFVAPSGYFDRHSIRFNKTPALSQHTWQRHVIMAVSRCTCGTSHAILFACAAFDIPSLLPGNSYTGPTGVDNGDTCKCNTVLYNLISACDACQGEPWISCVYKLQSPLGFQHTRS